MVAPFSGPAGGTPVAFLVLQNARTVQFFVSLVRVREQVLVSDKTDDAETRVQAVVRGGLARVRCFALVFLTWRFFYVEQL